jgi:DNA-binding transcriptional MerR regulator
MMVHGPPGRPLYSIGAVADMLRSTAATLRSWEERYGIVKPERTEAGRRLYSRDDLARLRFVKDRVDEGYSAADAHRLLSERMTTRGHSSRPRRRQKTPHSCWCCSPSATRSPPR